MRGLLGLFTQAQCSVDSFSSHISGEGEELGVVLPHFICTYPNLKGVEWLVGKIMGLTQRMGEINNVSSCDLKDLVTQFL